MGIDLVGNHDEVVGRLADHGHQARQGLVEEGDAVSTYVDDLGVYLGREDSDEQDLDTVAATAGGTGRSEAQAVHHHCFERETDRECRGRGAADESAAGGGAMLGSVVALVAGS
ncbi:MAG: hypothetical protein M3459_04135 [Actinomycetota bacterium]|nr:hypothetical protein [Actinomycetota bacterium]